MSLKVGDGRDQVGRERARAHGFISDPPPTLEVNLALAETAYRMP